MKVLSESILIIVKLIYLIIVCVPITIMLLIFINLLHIFKKTTQWISKQLKQK